MKRPFIIAIDDDEFYLNEIGLELDEYADYKVFQGPNDFEENICDEDIKRADLILVDYDFGYGTAVKSEIASYIRGGLGFKGKLLLWSLHEDFRENEKQIRSDYDYVFKKKDLSWDKLKSLLK